MIEVRECSLLFGAESFSMPSKNIKIVLCWCETWSLILREECTLRVFQKWVLGTIFGPMRDEVKAEWRRLHNKELYALCSSPDITRVMKSRRK